MTYASAVLADSPSAYWRFDDAAASNTANGVWSDSSSNGTRNLINGPTGSDPLIQQAGLLTGSSSQAVNTAAGGGRFATAANAAWNQLSTFSVDLVFQAGAASGNFLGAYTGTASTSSWLFWCNGSFQFVFSVRFPPFGSVLKPGKGRK